MHLLPIPPSSMEGRLRNDPVFVDSAHHFTAGSPELGRRDFHRAEPAAGIFRPMLKSGDFELMKPQFEFYQRILGNAEIRTKHYWGENGASFTEQIENFGLPNYASMAWKRPAG